MHAANFSNGHDAVCCCLIPNISRWSHPKLFLVYHQHVTLMIEWTILTRKAGIMMQIAPKHQITILHVSFRVQDVLMPHKVYPFARGHVVFPFFTHELMHAQEPAVLTDRLACNRNLWEVCRVVLLKLRDEAIEIEGFWAHLFGFSGVGVNGLSNAARTSPLTVPLQGKASLLVCE